MKFENIKKSKEFSKEKIDAIQKEFEDSINNKNISIVTTGSFARGEANELSDLDIFIIVKNNTNELLFEEKEKISQIVSKHISKNVGDSGTFGIFTGLKKVNYKKNFFPKGESNYRLKNRVSKVFKKIELENKSLIVSHSRVFKTICEILQIKTNSIKNCEIVKFEETIKNNWKISYF